MDLSLLTGASYRYAKVGVGVRLIQLAPLLKRNRKHLMKVAIVHYWLVGMRGGEKVIEALCEMYPQADIFTHVYVPEMISERIRQHRIIPTFINSLPRAE